MRLWRKIHSDLITSERLSQVSYEARWLYVLLLLAQDDEGRFPWSETRVKALVVTTLWTYGEASQHLTELERIGAVRNIGQRVEIRRGKELNGRPRPDRPTFLYATATITPIESGGSTEGPGDIGAGRHTADIPLTYQRLTTDIPLTDESRVEKSRVEKSNIHVLYTETCKPKDPVPTSRDIGGIPETWKPLMELKGFVFRDYTKTIAIFREACLETNVDEGELLAAFAEYYKAERVRHGWRDPVAALRRTLALQISKQRKEHGDGPVFRRNSQKGSGETPPGYVAPRLIGGARRQLP